MGFIRALTFLTRFPIYPKFIDEHLLARSTVYFPIVGLLIGLILGYMDIILGYLFHDAVRAIILIIAYITITGGLHLDGLVDTFDGILGGYTKEEILEIMRDSSMGTFGGIALIVSLMLKFALYISFTNEIRFVALILAPSISRWIMVASITFFPYAREEGKGKIFANNVMIRDFFLAGLLSITASYILGKSLGLVATFLTLIFTFFPMIYFNSKIKGMTGDTYGAINEISELVFLIVFSALHI